MQPEEKLYPGYLMLPNTAESVGHYPEPEYSVSGYPVLPIILPHPVDIIRIRIRQSPGRIIYGATLGQIVLDVCHTRQRLLKKGGYPVNV